MVEKRTIRLNLPELRPPVGSVPRHVRAVLEPSDGLTVARLRDGLRAEGALGKSGRVVGSFPDAVRWLLDRIADAFGPDGMTELTESDEDAARDAARQAHLSRHPPIRI
jgi:hypothetical protein